MTDSKADKVPRSVVNQSDIEDLEDEFERVERQVRILLITQVVLAAKAMGVPLDSIWTVLITLL